MDIFEAGKRIKKIRKSLKLTQEQLAEKAGISAHFVYEIEHGQKTMRLYTLTDIALALGTSTDYILFGRTPDISSGARDVMINDDLSHIIETVPLSKRDAIKNIVKSVLPYIK